MTLRPLALLAGALIVFLCAPIAVVVLYAFNAGSNLTWPPEGLSLRWVEAMVQDAAFQAAIETSLQVALLATVISTLVGGAAAMVFVRQRWWAPRLVESASRLPIMLPPLLIGVALLTTIAALDIALSRWTVVAGHVIYVIPYVVVIVAARLRGFDFRLEQAARDLGAGRLETLSRVTLPIIAPAVLGAGLLAFGLSFDETYITNFTAGDDSTLPLFVLSKLRRSIDPSINAVATVLLIVPWIAIGLAALLLKRSISPRRPAYQANAQES